MYAVCVNRYGTYFEIKNVTTTDQTTEQIINNFLGVLWF